MIGASISRIPTVVMKGLYAAAVIMRGLNAGASGSAIGASIGRGLSTVQCASAAFARALICDTAYATEWFSECSIPYICTNVSCLEPKMQ